MPPRATHYSLNAHVQMVIALLAWAATQAAQSDSLTIAQALQLALEHRPRVRAISAAVREAAGEVRMSSRVANPTVDLSRVDETSERRLSVQQPMAWLPRWPSDVGAARAAYAGARQDSVQALSDFARDVRIAFYVALSATEQARLVSDQAAIADSVAGLAARRASAGDISDLERDQLAQEGLRARLAASQARAESAEALAVLARAVGWPSRRTPRPAGPLDAELDAPSVTPTYELDALPSVRALADAEIAARRRLRATQWARLPLPGLFLEHDYGSIQPSSTRLGLSVPVPIWSQGNEAVAVARWRAERASSDAAEGRLAADARVATAQTRLAEASARARVARDTLAPLARRTREGTLRLYEEGRVSAIAVLDGLRAERDAQITLVKALRDFQAARAELTAAVGGMP